MYGISMRVWVCMHAIFLCAFVCMIITKYAHMYKCCLFFYVANLGNLACMNINMYVNMYACMYVRMYVCTHLNMYV